MVGDMEHLFLFQGPLPSWSIVVRSVFTLLSKIEVHVRARSSMTDRAVVVNETDVDPGISRNSVT
jgi:hypothetical protein